MNRTVRVASTLVAIPILLSGCSSDRPSETDLSQAIQEEGNVLGVAEMLPKQAKCLAAELRKSGLSDETLKAIADGDTGYTNGDADAKIMVGLAEEVAKCAEG